MIATNVEPRLLTFGETMGLFTANGVGTLDFVRNMTVTIGGAESNVAIGVSRLGHPVTWIGRLGRDAAGDLIEGRLKAEHVDTVAIRDCAYTGLMVRHCRAGTAVHVDYHRAGSAGSCLIPNDVPDQAVERATIMHITGVTPALSDSARNTVFHAVDVARAAGVTVSVDVNYRSKLWSHETAGPVLSQLIARADIVFAGIEEAQLVLDTDNAVALDLAHQLAALGPREAVIKDGARGCAAVIDDVALTEPAVPVTVIDPVGAGDAFVAGFIAEHLAGADAAHRLLTAAAMGAYAVTVPGDCELLPTRAELAALTSTQDVHR